jgi:hypothetical protein
VFEMVGINRFSLQTFLNLLMQSMTLPLETEKFKKKKEKK